MQNILKEVLENEKKFWSPKEFSRNLLRIGKFKSEIIKQNYKCKTTYKRFKKVLKEFKRKHYFVAHRGAEIIYGGDLIEILIKVQQKSKLKQKQIDEKNNASYFSKITNRKSAPTIQLVNEWVNKCGYLMSIVFSGDDREKYVIKLTHYKIIRDGHI